MVALTDVLWIGGSSSAGKSTTARLLARRHGLRCFSTDTATWAHRDRAIAAGDRAAIAWERLTAEQRQGLPPADQLRFDFDRWPWVLQDVDALPEYPAVVVEGTAIAPDRLPAGCVAVWLTATPEVRASRTARRSWGAAGGAVDALKASVLEDQLVASGAPQVDTTDRSPADVIAIVEGIARRWLERQQGVTDWDQRRAA